MEQRKRGEQQKPTWVPMTTMPSSQPAADVVAAFGGVEVRDGDDSGRDSDSVEGWEYTITTESLDRNMPGCAGTHAWANLTRALTLTGNNYA